MSVPKNIIVAMPVHMGLPLIIIGRTPIDAQADVKNIGRIRRQPASKAA